MAGEKRSQDHDNALRQETVVLIDIEGTTTSISFVKDTLFPYVREHLKAYIEKKWDDDELKADIESLKEQAKKDETDKVEGLVAITGEADELKESLIKNVFWQMDNDRKTSALKQLQGHIWRDAYKSGVVKGHVYEDVPKALEAWIKDGRKVYVYSSGSVEAQKLLFGHSEHGDLLKYFSGYFDTEVGPKQKASSYKTILAKMDCEASKVLFLTDIANESKAAVEAGMSSALVVRKGNAALTDEEKAAYPTINSFSELSFQAPSKRPKLEETEKPKKAEEPAATAAGEATAAAAVEDVEMTDVSEKTVEKTDEPEAKTVVEAEKKTEPSDKATVEEAKKTDEAMETSETPADAPKDKEKVSDELKTTKNTDELVDKVSTETTKPETETKSPPEPKADEKKIETAKKSSESTSKTTESKTEKAEVVEEKKTVEPKVVEAKAEVTAEEPVATAADAPTTKVTVEAKATEAVVAEVKPEEVKPEQTVVAKTEEKKIEPEEKVGAVVVEDKKQNGEAKSAPEATSITNGAEVNGSTTSEKSAKQPEPEKTADSAQPEATEVAAEPAAVEPAAATTAAKEDETKAASPAGTVAATTAVATTETAEKKLNGSAPSSDKAADSDDTKTHRNGVTDENKQNGEEETSLADKEAIKVKKVVESLAADGAAESEVVPPVAVVAATS